MMRMAVWWMMAAGIVLGGNGFAGAVDEPSGMLDGYVLLGLGEVTLRDRVVVESGDVGCNAPSCAVTLKNRARVDGLVAADRIVLGRRAAGGQLFCTQLVPRRPTETACVPVTPPLLDDTTLPLVQVTPGRERVRLPRLATRDPLDAGEYGVVEVAARGRLVLSGGEYSLRSLFLGPGASLVCEGACTIAVARRVRLGTAASLGPAPGLDARAVRVEVKGGRGLPAFRARRRSRVDAIVYAPNGSVFLGMSGQYTGRFVGARVLVYPRARVRLATDG